MAKESKEVSNEKSKEERMKALKDKAKKVSKVDASTFAKQLATRQLLERDYKEDKLYVTFNSSPETKRTVLSRKPNQEEFIKLLTLTIEASRYSGKMDEKSLTRMKEIFSDLNVMAGDLSVDKTLTPEFWGKYVSYETLQNFIAELINASQGSGITESDMKSFR